MFGAALEQLEAQVWRRLVVLGAALFVSGLVLGSAITVYVLFALTRWP